jgi:hypothetical protein
MPYNNFSSPLGRNILGGNHEKNLLPVNRVFVRFSGRGSSCKAGS